MGKEKLGLVYIYTGDGKGKTTTSLGVALRAVGQNLKVHIIQFLKGGAYTGEYIAITNYLPNISIEQFGKPCIKEKRQLKLEQIDGKFPKGDFVREDIECGDCRECFLQDEEERLLVRTAFERAKKVCSSGDYDLVILDEINNSIQKGLLKIDEVLEMIKHKYRHTELVLTGRGAPQEIMEIADLVTDMREVKHPFRKGILARRGIEY